jgi:PAS domain S-box-containing protein
MRAREPILDHVDGVVLCLEAETLAPLYASAATRALVGEPVEAWRARPGCWRRLFDPEDWPRIARLCHAVARDGRRRQARHLVRVGSGRPRAFRTSVSLLGGAARAGRLLAHMLDLSGADGEGARVVEEAGVREILRHAPLAAFLVDRGGVVRLAEGRGLAGLGLDSTAVLGRSMLRGRWPYAWIVENARRALRGEAFSEIASVRGRGQSWLSVKYVPLRDRSGRVQGAVGFATDITECKRVVDLVGTIDAVLWQVQGADRRLSFIGGSAAKLFGEDPEPWLGRSDFFERLLVGDERDDVLHAVDAVAADGVERTIAHRVRRGDGRERWCRTTLRAVPDGAAGRRDVVALMLDVTERRAIEKALVPKDRRWQLLAEQAPAIVYTVDRDLCFSSGIGAGLAALGLQPTGTLVGVPVEHYFHGPHARPIVDAHRRALAGATVRTRARWRRRTYDVRLEPLRADDDAAFGAGTAGAGPGGIIGVVGVAVDVTQQDRRDRKRERLLEAERAAHAQADEAVHLRDQLFGVASHELRTPLASLLFTIQSARAGAISEETGRKLQHAERQALRLNRMIEQLLDASRLSAGHRLELEPEDVDLGALTHQVVARFEPELDASKMAVAVQAAGPVVGRWDRTRLDQVITNLLSNAIKYGRGKPVEIAVDAARPGLARLSVRDYGVGITSADQAQLFRPFRRLHAEQHFGGFGLGLFIVFEIVRAHGGEVRIESEAQQGALFTVELPMAATSTATAIG